MNLETIYFKTQDGIQLGGILYKGKKETKKMIISVHGMATNCLKKREDEIAKKIEEVEFDYFTFNNRGHDLTNYLHQEKNGKEESIILGMSYEDITQSDKDILGAIGKAVELGYEEIYLLGHSLGSTKVVYSYHQFIQKEQKEILDKIKGIILLSLIDIPLAVKVYLKDKFPAMLTYANNLVREGLGRTLMPEESFIYPISAQTFLQYAKNNEAFNFARYSQEDYDFSILNEIQIPLLMRWGNQNELIIQKAGELSQNVKSKIKNPKADIHYIDGADHNYKNKEKELAKEIKQFITKNQ